MPKLAPALDNIYARALRVHWLQRFTAFVRVLLAISFIPSGLTKVFGHRFTILSPETSVGYFFDAFFQAEEYYAFVGLSQVLAGVLLLLPRTATLGAVVYFPIILNIFVITVAVGFQGTPVITGLMLLACTYLLLWDYPRLKTLLPGRSPRSELFGRREYLMAAAAWTVAGMACYGLIASQVITIWSQFGWGGFALAALGGAAFGVVQAWHLRRLPASTPDEAA